MDGQTLKKEILEQIIKGELKPGEKLPSERELALQKSLARGTVGRVLRELEEEGFIITIRGKGRFVKDFRDRQRTMTIGVVFWDFAHSIHPVGIELLKGIEEVISEKGYRVIIYSAKNAPSLPPSKSVVLKVVPTERVDGLIVASQELPAEGIMRASHLLPIVACNLSLSPQIPQVLADYAWVGYRGVEHLVERGCRKIALINAWETFPIARNLQEGYRLGLERFGITFSRSYVRTGYYDFDCGYQLAKSLLELVEFDGLICADDFLAAGAIRAIRDAGLSVPQDIAVIGCNDLPIARMIEPPLTTFRIDFQEMGREAARLLLQLLEKEEIKETLFYLKPTLVVRKSA